MSAPFLSIILSFVKHQTLLLIRRLTHMAWTKCVSAGGTVQSPRHWGWWWHHLCGGDSWSAAGCLLQAAAERWVLWGIEKSKKWCYSLIFFLFFKSNSRIISVFFVSCSLFLCAFWIHALDMLTPFTLQGLFCTADELKMALKPNTR